MMGFLERYIDIRPYAFHVSQGANLTRLLRTRRLEPSATLIERSDRPELLRQRRKRPETIRVDGDSVVLQDQAPLVFANIKLPPEWNEGDFVEFLNRHVFFWPGRADDLINSGRRLLNHYETQAPVLLRVRTKSLLRDNPNAVPLFCPFNSGATLRKQNGQTVRRGPDLFSPEGTFPRTPGKVVELVFRGTIELPRDLEHRDANGSWRSISAAP
jgi:hypothetical protein